MVFVADNYLLSKSQRYEFLRWMGEMPDLWWQTASVVLLIPSWFFWKKFFK